MSHGEDEEAAAHARLMDHVRNPRHSGLLEPADARARAVNPLCGDTVELTLRFDGGGRVAALGFAGVGCSVSQGAASMLCERALGRAREELLALSEREVLDLVGLELNNNRKKCALVALRVLRQAAAQAR
jgi:nitrogen fixation NifU-like protein